MPAAAADAWSSAACVRRIAIRNSGAFLANGIPRLSQVVHHPVQGDARGGQQLPQVDHRACGVTRFLSRGLPAYCAGSEDNLHASPAGLVQQRVRSRAMHQQQGIGVALSVAAADILVIARRPFRRALGVRVSQNSSSSPQPRGDQPEHSAAISAHRILPLFDGYELAKTGI